MTPQVAESFKSKGIGLGPCTGGAFTCSLCAAASATGAHEGPNRTQHSVPTNKMRDPRDPLQFPRRVVVLANSLRGFWEAAQEFSYLLLEGRGDHVLLNGRRPILRSHESFLTTASLPAMFNSGMTC